ncbi:MAG: MauE/DoxX family redox-associated membrane protein [Candidatus Acidiferrum sp.]
MSSQAMVTEFPANEQAKKSPAQVRNKSAWNVRPAAEWLVRLALGAAFLSSLADRFGIWGAPGKPNVDWGDFAHFTRYVGMVNSFMPARTIPVLAWVATIAETTFGIGLILGMYKQAVALGSAILLLLFATAMAISFGIKSPLDYAVFSASAAAFLLFALQREKAAKDRRG